MDGQRFGKNIIYGTAIAMFQDEHNYFIVYLDADHAVIRQRNPFGSSVGRGRKN